jgi:hypothetical protein
MGLFVDGVLASPSCQISLQSGAGAGVQTTCSYNTVVNTTPGSHTLTLEFRSVSGATANFSAPCITATPY